MDSTETFHKTITVALLSIASVIEFSDDDANKVYSALSYQTSLIGPNGFRDVIHSYKKSGGRNTSQMKKYFKGFDPGMDVVSDMELHSIIRSYKKEEYDIIVHTHLSDCVIDLLKIKRLSTSQLFIEYICEMFITHCIVEQSSKVTGSPNVFVFIRGWVQVSDKNFTTMLQNYLLRFEPTFEGKPMPEDLLGPWRNKVKEVTSNTVLISRVAKSAMHNLVICDLDKKRIKYEQQVLFSNGVYNIKTNEFKPIMPHHLQENQLPYKFYEMGSDPNSEKELDDLLRSFFPSKQKLEYILHAFAKCLSGSNYDKKMWFLLGNSNAGKSKFTNLINYTFGDYATILPPEFFNGKKKSSPSDASPAVSMTIGKLVGIIQEPPQTGFNIEQMKHLTGETQFTSRKLYSEFSKTSYDLTIRYFISANMTDINSFDGAFWRRAVRVDFESTFLPEKERQAKTAYIKKHFDTPEYASIRKFDTLEEELSCYPPQDTHIDNKSKKLAPILMSKLIQYYNEDKNLDTDFPEVEQSTKQFRKRNDPVLRYTVENIINTDEEESSSILLNTMFEHFKQWYTSVMPNRYMIDCARFGECLQQLGYIISTNKRGAVVHHAKFKSYQEDSEEDECHFEY